MQEKALKYLLTAWDAIKSGDFFNEQVNNTFEMMLRSLWKTDKHDEIKADILANLNAIHHKIKGLETPAPVLLILLSLKDEDIVRKIEGLMIADFIGDKGTEQSVFNIGNLINTLSDRNISVAVPVNLMIKSISQDFSKDFTLALAHIISIQHPEFVGAFVKKFMGFGDESWLKNYITSVGKRALLEAIKIADPEKMNKLMKGVNAKTN